MLSRGFASGESKVAFTRAQRFGKQIGDAEERFDAYYAPFISQLLRGELVSAIRARDRGRSGAKPKARDV